MGLNPDMDCERAPGRMLVQPGAGHFTGASWQSVVQAISIVCRSVMPKARPENGGEHNVPKRVTSWSGGRSPVCCLKVRMVQREKGGRGRAGARSVMRDCAVIT